MGDKQPLPDFLRELARDIQVELGLDGVVIFAFIEGSEHCMKHEVRSHVDGNLQVGGAYMSSGAANRMHAKFAKALKEEADHES